MCLTERSYSTETLLNRGEGIWYPLLQHIEGNTKHGTLLLFWTTRWLTETDSRRTDFNPTTWVGIERIDAGAMLCARLDDCVKGNIQTATEANE